MPLSLVSFFLVLSFSLLSSAQTSSMIEKRLTELEQRVNELSQQNAEFQAQWLEGRGQVHSFFSNSVFLGGFFESAVTAVNGPDTESQISANSHILGLNIAANLSEKFRFVTQLLTGLSYTFQNPHNNPLLTPPRRQYGVPSFGAIVAQGYIEYLHSPGLRVQAGLGYAPFGYAIQQREMVLFKRRGGPQLASTSGSNSLGIAFPLWMGAHVLGAFPVNDNDWGYDLYSFSPFNNAKTLGVGSRLWWRHNNQFTLGISGQSAKDKDENSNSYGFDFNGKTGRFGLAAEYARNVVTHTGSPESYYAEPFVTFQEDTLLLFLVADYLNNATYTSIRSGGSISDPYKKWITGAGLNWLPTPFVRLRLTYLNHQYVGDTAQINEQDRNYQSWDLSAGITF